MRSTGRLRRQNDPSVLHDKITMIAAVELENATLRIGGRTVLRDVSFAIRPGEFIGVLGPNGSGKTTLMRAVLGLCPPVTGRLRLFGEEPHRGDPKIGYLPQTRTVIPDLRMRGLDFIGAALHGHRWGLPARNSGDERVIGEALAAVGARELATRPLSDMSGGERQRLLLAQALIGRPKLLLLDEPLIMLDARHQEVAIEVVRKLSREHGTTVLFSAHELNQLISAVDRVLYLGHGQAALGSIDEVVTAPVLSRLYGTEIEVIKTAGRIFVMSRGQDVERVEHMHDHGDGHDHGHHHDH
jgi:zinc/manganese transport system ATP-binding protein